MRAKGSVLLLSLLVLASVLLTATGVADLVLRSLARSRITDAGTVAYYAAESGAEDTLYRIRKDRNAPAALDGSGASLGNASSWTRSVASPARITGSINQDDFLPIDLFDPDDVTRAAGVGSLAITWTESGCSNCTTLLVDSVMLPVAVPNQWADNAAHARLPWNASGITINLDANIAYRLRLTADGGDMQNLTVIAYDGDGNEMNVPFARVQVVSTGSFGAAQKFLRMVVPRNEFLTGLFQNLIWSDCSIVKNAAASCP